MESKEFQQIVNRRPIPSGNLGQYLLGQVIDVVRENLLQKLDVSMRQRLELPPSVADLKAQASLHRTELQLEQIRRRIAIDERKQGEAELKAVVSIARAQGRVALDERRTRLYDLQIAKAEIEVERQRQRLEAGDHLALPAGVDEPIQGALDFRANPSGISGEVRSGYMAWLDSLELGKVILILGKRGSGKSAFALKLGEYLYAVHEVPVWLVGIPEDVSVYLPRWVSIAQDIEQVDLGAFIIVDESGLQFMAMRYQSDANTVMRRLLMIARHRKQSLVFICQVASDVDKAVVRQSDCIVFKQPTLMQPKNDRPEVRDIAGRALKVFDALPKDEKLRTAYIHDGDFVGVLQCDLPDYWREELSFAFANVPLSDPATGQPDAETALSELDQAELKRKALEMRRDGLSQTQIAGSLGVGRKRIRNVLEDIERPTGENQGPGP